VIVNTHSPGVVGQAADDTILGSELQEIKKCWADPPFFRIHKKRKLSPFCPIDKSAVLMEDTKRSDCCQQSFCLNFVLPT
jgi:hypothetical protein